MESGFHPPFPVPDYLLQNLPENLLLDAKGNLKVSDFGLSALSRQVGGDGLLHTACGTPNYAAPEVLNDQGYDGATADLWSCGVILFVLLAGYLPFEDSNLMTLYKKIIAGEYHCPPWLSPGAKNLIVRILDPNPMTKLADLEAKLVSLDSGDMDVVRSTIEEFSEQVLRLYMFKEYMFKTLF